MQERQFAGRGGLRCLGTCLLLVFGLGFAPTFGKTEERTFNSVGHTYFGGMLGFSSVDHNVGAGPGFAFQGAYFFGDLWGMGASVRGGNHSNGISSFFVSGEGLFRFRPEPHGFHVGALLGAGRFSAGTSRGNTSFAFGAKAVYDFAMSRQYPVTVGVETTLLLIEPKTTTLTVLSPLVTAKWWL